MDLTQHTLDVLGALDLILEDDFFRASVRENIL